MATHQATPSCSSSSERYLLFPVQSQCSASTAVTTSAADFSCANHRLPHAACTTCESADLYSRQTTNSKAVFHDVKNVLHHRHLSHLLSFHQLDHNFQSLSHNFSQLTPAGSSVGGDLNDSTHRDPSYLERSNMSSQRATTYTFSCSDRSSLRHTEHSSLSTKLRQPLSVMTNAPSDGIVLWVPRVLLYSLAIWLLLSTAVSASSSDTYSQSNSLASFIKRSPGDSLSPYMKPSQFFLRYFSCRFELQRSSRPKMPSEDILEPHLERENGEEGGQAWQQISLNGTWRHSKRQNRLHKKQRITCPADCDGVTKWPETASNTVHHISCLDVLQNVEKIPSTVIVDEHEMGSVGEGQSESESGDIKPNENLVKLDSSFNEPVSIKGYIDPDKLVSFNATRRCSVDGVWELHADYTKCGFESRRLFVLTSQQLEKIYDLRQKMINAKYTHLPQTEQEFVNCVDTVLSQAPSQLPEPFCERTFDGWTCFNDTPASHVIYFKCPNFIYGFNSQNEGHKTCTAAGKWKVHQETLLPWTNYTSCVDIPDFHFRRIIIQLHIIGYSISLLALLISLCIFFSFKTLSSQTRIRIHKNFFVSFIINNFMWIIWYFAITDQNMLLENGLYCQSLHVMLHYFLLCNYFWMFCEGLYLHTILVVAFVSEEKILKWFYLIGWGIPVLFATAYAVLRGNSPDTANCWIDESKYTWILNVPVLMSFLLNIFFLFNIVRVLVTKLQAVNTADTHQTRKAVRATLILIPLLGLHFILTPFRPETNSSAAQAYEVFSAVVSSLQGFCVAMLFCFFNGEVLSHIRKRWNQFLLVHGYNSDRRMSYGGTTVSMRLSNYNLNSAANSTLANNDSKATVVNNNGHHNDNCHYDGTQPWKSIADDDNHVAVSGDKCIKGTNGNGTVPNDQLHFEHLTSSSDS